MVYVAGARLMRPKVANRGALKIENSVLDVVHDVRVALGDERREHRDQDPRDRHQATGSKVVRTVPALTYAEPIEGAQLAAMNAKPVIQAGSERPDKKKSRSVLIASLAINPIPITTTK